MTEGEIRSVEGFKVWNEFGEIEFEGPTDLSYLNLDEIISIENKTVFIFV